MLVGTGIWAYGITNNLIEQDMLNALLHVIGAAIFAVGILLPVKSFFAR